MKIDGANQHSDALRPIDRSRERDSARSGSKTASSTDRVDISGDANLLNTAIQVARSLPEFRAELVTAMQHKLHSGDLGRDSVRLADHIIERLLEHG